MYLNLYTSCPAGGRLAGGGSVHAVHPPEAGKAAGQDRLQIREGGEEALQEGERGAVGDEGGQGRARRDGARLQGRRLEKVPEGNFIIISLLHFGFCPVWILLYYLDLHI